MTKQVTIHLARRVTLNRAGHEAVELNAGRNTVDADVAAHPFVKAHTVDAGPDHSDELDALRARVADLEEQLAQKCADLDAVIASLAVPAADAKPAKPAKA